MSLLLNNALILPEVLISEIYSYIPFHYLLLVSKKHYEKYNVIYRTSILKKNSKSISNNLSAFIESLLDYEKQYFLNPKIGLRNNLRENYSIETYTRMCIKKDFDYVFTQLYKAEHNHWKNIKKYKYRGHRFPTYFDFIKQFISEKRANKCQEVIRFFSQEKNKKSKRNNNVRKKKIKKIKRISNRWSN